MKKIALVFLVVCFSIILSLSSYAEEKGKNKGKPPKNKLQKYQNRQRSADYWATPGAQLEAARATNNTQSRVGTISDTSIKKAGFNKKVSQKLDQ